MIKISFTTNEVIFSEGDNTKKKKIFTDSVFDKYDKPGIYAILTTDGECRYVGYSGSIAKRLKEHRRNLSSNKHPSFYLQETWNKYGSDRFVFIILEMCNKSYRLKIREDFWIKKLKPDCNVVYGLSGKTNPKAPSLKSIFRFNETDMARYCMAAGIKALTGRDIPASVRGMFKRFDKDLDL